MVHITSIGLDRGVLLAVYGGVMNVTGRWVMHDPLFRTCLPLPVYKKDPQVKPSKEGRGIGGPQLDNVRHVFAGAINRHVIDNCALGAGASS
jgi:hypothetical protein